MLCSLSTKQANSVSPVRRSNAITPAQPRWHPADPSLQQVTKAPLHAENSRDCKKLLNQIIKLNQFN